MGGHGEAAEAEPIERKRVHDVVSDSLRGGCGAADHWDVGELAFEEVQLFERRAEVMAPFGYAVSLVDGNAGQFALLMDGTKTLAEVVEGTVFRGDVQ